MLSIRIALIALLIATPPIAAQQSLPALPDTTGWGVHVLTAERGPDGSTWVGTYGRGIYRFRPGASRWEHITSDTVPGSISWDFVHAFGFGPRGEIWYGTVGNGWGVSLDDGKTWKNWTFDQLRPEWQYVAPRGIVTEGDTTYIATADGVQITTNNGASWTALVDSVGPAAKGPADTALVVLRCEYITRIHFAHGLLALTTPCGRQILDPNGGRWRTSTVRMQISESASMLIQSSGWEREAGSGAGAATIGPLRTTWFRRPIDSTANWHIDQTYRYGSTMGGNFQPHQGVEFNNQDGTPVHAIGAGVVVYAGRAERGALTVAIRHDTALRSPQGRFNVYSVYYHNNELLAKVGDRVKTGDVISRVGHTGRATNDHLHLEVHASPVDSVNAIVDSLNRFPPYTTNPELWIQPLPGTGLVAGQVFDSAGVPIPQARVYGLVKPEPRETPYSFAETYGNRNHPHPLYGEHFAVSDVPPGEYVLGVEIHGRKVVRRIRVEAGRVTWVEFKPGQGGAR
jgi:murein DD-endopeptidase MepM/ murein hydrolase activator NlpD